MEDDIPTTEQVKNLGLWLIDLGNHIISHPELIEQAVMNYEPLGNTSLNSPYSYENHCKLSISIIKNAG